ncbi:MAG: hypothetical protein ACR2MT_05830 [Aurantibacter sp.]
MNNLLLICGLVLLSSAPAQENKENEKVYSEMQTVYVTADATDNLMVKNAEEKVMAPKPKLASVGSISDCEGEAELDLDEIIFIEEEAKIELGFDTADYLPENFDPYKLYVDLNAVEYIEDEEEIELNFNVADYLPANFDPYADPAGIEGINYIEDEVEIELGFDTAEYLPLNFDPYAGIDEQKDVTAL